jgi:hypothetical protein
MGTLNGDKSRYLGKALKAVENMQEIEPALLGARWHRPKLTAR